MDGEYIWSSPWYHLPVAPRMEKCEFKNNTWSKKCRRNNFSSYRVWVQNANVYILNFVKKIHCTKYVHEYIPIIKNQITHKYMFSNSQVHFTIFNISYILHINIKEFAYIFIFQDSPQSKRNTVRASFSIQLYTTTLAYSPWIEKSVSPSWHLPLWSLLA